MDVFSVWQDTSCFLQQYLKSCLLCTQRQVTWHCVHNKQTTHLSSQHTNTLATQGTKTNHHVPLSINNVQYSTSINLPHQQCTYHEPCRGWAIKEEKWPPTTTQTAQREKDNKWTRYQPALEVTAVTSTTDTRWQWRIYSHQSSSLLDSS